MRCSHIDCEGMLSVHRNVWGYHLECPECYSTYALTTQRQVEFEESLIADLTQNPDMSLSHIDDGWLEGFNIKLKKELDER